MNNLWRISNHVTLEGLGGERTDGRWHTAARGKRIVYLTEHPAVALIEALAHLKGDPDLLPDHYQLLEVEVEDEVFSRHQIVIDESGRCPRMEKPESWTRGEGDRWLREESSALLVVPSFPSPFSLNYLLNPLHPDARLVRVVKVHRIEYDRRLFKVGEPDAPRKGPVGRSQRAKRP